LHPAAWGPRGFDPVTQVFSWMLPDGQGRPVTIEIDFDAFSEPAIRYLESADLKSIEGAVVIGRVQKAARRISGGLSVRAYSIHRNDGEIVHLSLDNSAPASGQSAAAAGNDEEVMEAEEQFEPVVRPGSALSGLLDEADEILLIAAEAGTRGLHAGR